MKTKLIFAVFAAFALLIGCAGVKPYVQDFAGQCRQIYYGLSGNGFTVYQGGSDSLTVYLSMSEILPVMKSAAPSSRAPSGDEPIDVSLEGLPAGVTVTVNGQSLPHQFTVPEDTLGTYDVVVSADNSVPQGSYNLILHVSRAGCATLDFPLTLSVQLD